MEAGLTSVLEHAVDPLLSFPQLLSLPSPVQSPFHLHFFNPIEPAELLVNSLDEPLPLRPHDVVPVTLDSIELHEEFDERVLLRQER